MRIIDFVPEHVLSLKPQPSQSYLTLNIQYGEYLMTGNCFTGIHAGEVVAVGGLLPVCDGRVYLHMIVSDGMPHQWTKLYRAASRLIDAVKEDCDRIETLSTTPEADRWLEMLGFEYEGTLRRVMPGGLDAKSYSIVRT